MLRTNVDISKLEIVLVASAEDNNIKNLINQAGIIIAVSSAGITNLLDKEKLIYSSTNLFSLLQGESNGKFYYIGTKNFGFNNNFLAQRELQNIPKYRVNVNMSTLTANKIEKLIWGKHYIDIIDLLIDDNNKISVFTNNGDFISFDTEHTTKKGAIFIGNIIFHQTKLKDIFK